MKKININFLVLGVVFLTLLGMVSATSGVDFVTPTAGQSVSGTLNVQWNNTNSLTNLYLQYRADNCGVGTWTDLTGSLGGSTLTHLWDTTNVNDSQYCLRLQFGNDTYSTSGLFTIDNTLPMPIIQRTGSLIVGEILTFNASDSTDNNAIASYSWDFGDKTTSTNAVETKTYSNKGDYEVVLTVEDIAGNSNSTTLKITIDPITYETDEIVFEASILGENNLDNSFDTGLSSVTCSIISSGIPTNLSISSSANNCTFVWNNIPYEDRGEYEISVKATNATQTKYFTVDLSVYTWWINLVEGWNLISIPMMPKDTGIEEVLGEIVDNVAYETTSTYTIFQYNPENQKWYRAKKSSATSSTYSGPSSYKLTEIVPGYGYWIKMADDDVLKGYGNLEPGMDQVISVNVANGWNLIGHYGLDKTGNWANESLTSLSLGSTQYYDSVITDDGKMKPYKAYWTSVKFLPNEVASYTPAQKIINFILGI
ncbi:MAG: PKD domain-containing protein [Nanoarchaeota archaeon]|nr:PKD domain-containing protein [Nanoarchaeota archaeon]